MNLLKFALLKSCSLYYHFFSPPPFFIKNHELCAVRSTLLELPIFLSWFVFTCESLRIQFSLIQLSTYLLFPPPISNQNTYNWNKNILFHQLIPKTYLIAIVQLGSFSTMSSTSVVVFPVTIFYFPYFQPSTFLTSK